MKQIISNYSFNAAIKTITFTDFVTVRLERILIITNVTRQQVLYQFNDPALSGTVAGNVLQLQVNFSGMANNDKLQIFYEAGEGDPLYEAAVPVSQGDLRDDLDSVAIRGQHSGYGPFAASSVSTLIAATDVRKYASFVVKLTGSWVATVQFEYSMDGVSFSVYSTVGTNGNYVFPRIGAYFRANVTVHSTGTVTAIMQAYALPVQLAAGNVGVAVPPHAVYSGIRDSVGNLAGMASATAVGDNNTGNNILAVEGFGFNGATHDRLRIANIFKTISSADAGDVVAWTPAAGKRFRLLAYCVELTADAAKSIPGNFTLTLKDAASSVGISHDLYIPAQPNGGVGVAYTSGYVPLGNGKLSMAANNVLNLHLSDTLIAGIVRLNVMGTEE